MGAYRGLTITEIEQLKRQNCMADDWSAISVTKDFIPDHICHTRFSGQIKLGAFKKEFTLDGGLKLYITAKSETMY